ncbi:auxin-responsive protein IAA1-like isoform X2 [Rutidosis leptorrhynchoides]|uniref:auxin-responsive protein IAA1-like isoform X2 n=1 Tax=Rutidosis leptorrhynchoides TaxID=125765 RepID=UPI003A9A47A4
MSLETSNITSEPPSTTINVNNEIFIDLNDTELTLGLPGESRKLEAKRKFPDVFVLKLGRNDQHDMTECSVVTKSSPSKEQIVGWPPVKCYRKNTTINDCKYVKVAVDGAPYLRKLDLQLYTCYQQLLCAFEHLFSSCFTIRNILNETKLMDPANGTVYVTTYEDKDGDWMLVGDVPWKMFVESCKRIRLMKNSETIDGSDLLKKF